LISLGLRGPLLGFSSGCGTMESGEGREHGPAVERCEGVELAKGGHKLIGIGLGAPEGFREGGTARSEMKAGDCPKAAQPGQPLGRLDVGPPRAESAAGRDHRRSPSGKIRRHGFKVFETWCLPRDARTYTYKADG
jgi:hypothetical protein